MLAGFLSILLTTNAWPAERQILHGHVPAAASRLAPVGRLAAAVRLRLAIGLPLRNQAELTQFLQELSDPASPNYRKYLTPAQFTERFGPSQQDYEAVIQYANAHGMTVTARHPNRVVLDVAATVSKIEDAFHVKMRTYRHPNEAREFHAPDTEPALDLPIPISHIGGLDDYALPRPALKPRPAGSMAKANPNSGSAPGGSYAGGDFRAAYVPGTALTGAGQSVGLLQFDGYYAADIAAYRTQFGLPAIPLVNVAVDGGVTTPGSGNSEVCLDIEMVMSMAPGISTIYVYEAPNPSPWVDLLSKMANDNLAKQLSCSWGGGGPDATAETIFQQMAAQGQTFFNATGDSDAFTGSISFPSDSPNIVEVGATTLTTTGAGGSYVSETVWNWGSGIGSSGGSSTYYTMPTWQQGVSMATNQGSTTMRNVPDVALTGDQVYVLYNNGSTGSFGGTSCAAPLWAGFTALVNQQATSYSRPTVGFLNPAIYTIGKSLLYSSDFRDTTAGNNFSPSSPSKFSAVTGYDLCTGWGSPMGTALINALAGPADSLLISPPSFASSGAPGGPFTPDSKTYTLSNSGSTALVWTAAVTQNWLTLSATGGTLAAGGSTTVIASLTANSNALATGTYSDTITYKNLTTGVAQPSQVSLKVAVPAPIMTVTPATTFTPSGSVGGPFTPTTSTYTVTNTGNASMNWTAGSLASWITLSPTGGTLASGGTATVTATINSSANSLASGTYTSTISFTNATNGNGSATRSATLTVYPPSVLFFNMNTDPGWTRQGQWAFGKPLGSGGASYGHPDPVAGASGTNVFGVNLAGDYSTAIGGPYYLIAGPFDFSGFTGLKLQFQRWLNSDYQPWVAATIDVSNNGTTWVQIFSNGSSTISDAAWTQVLYDISGVADSHSSVYVRWGYQIQKSGAFAYSGWNIDDVSFLGTAITPALAIAVPATTLKGLQTTGTTTLSHAISTATVVSLTSSNPALLTVPANATIVAGSTSALFPISATDDSLMDGTQIVTVTGSASGLGTVSGTIGILDHNVHHFTVSTTGSTQFAGVPFPVTVAAVDVNGVTIPSYNGTPGLTGSGDLGILTLGLVTAGPFANGIWTGSATANTLDTNVVIIVDDGSGHTGTSKPFNIWANLPVISVTPASDASLSGPQGGPFVPASAAYTITNSGTGLLSWNVSNTQPWLILSPTNGTLLTGSSTTITATLNSAANLLSVGSYADTVSFVNSTNDTGSTTRAVALTVVTANPVLSVSPASGLASSGTYGGPFIPSSIAYILSNTGNAPMTWTTTKTQPWLSLSATAGTLASGSGTTVTVTINSAANTVPPGSYADTIAFANTSNGNGNTSRAASLTVIVPAPPAITSSTMATGTNGSAFSYPITANNGPTSYNATGLPAWLAVNPATGLLSGTPNATGTFYGTISASNLGGTGSASLMVAIIPARPVVTSLPTATGTSNSAFSYQITASNSPTSYNATGLPSGLSVSTATGLISGTPTASGIFAPTISAANTSGTGSASLTLIILSPPPVITSTLTVTGTAGFSFGYQITATNSPTSYSATGLPSGLTVNPLTGLISGTPTATGIFSASIGATLTTGTAKFNNPANIAVDSSGTVYISDFGNHTIRAMLPGGIVTTLAGTPGVSGSSDGIGSAARFNNPDGVALDNAGNLFVADFQNSTVRQVTPSGIVTTLAGSPGLSGTLNGTGSSARFHNPTGLAQVGSGNIYVADYGNHTIRKVTPSGSVTTLAGFPGTYGTADGTGSTANFYCPQGVATDSSGNVYVGDQNNDTIRIITPAGEVTTMAGSPGISGSSDGTGSTARFNWPTQVMVDPNGIVYVADCYNHTIRKISPGGVVTTLAGSPGLSGTADGTGSGARFYYPQGMALDGSGSFYVADYGNSTIRKVTPNGTVTTVAGVPRVSGTSDGVSVTTSATLTLVILPPSPPVITSLPTATGTVSSAFSYQITASNGPTGFNATALPSGLSVSTATGLISGTPTISGTFASTITATNVTGTGSATLTIAIRPPPPTITSLTTATGTSNSAFSYQITATNNPTSYNATALPAGLSVNTATGLISGTPTVTGTVASTISAANSSGTGSSTLTLTILKAPPVVTSSPTVTGTAGSWLGYQITATNNPTSYSATGLPSGLTVNAVTGLISGTPTNTGTFSASIGATLTTGTAKFFNPAAIAVNGSGTIYISDFGNHTIRAMTPGGSVTTLAGTPGVSGSSDGVGSAARFKNPDGIGLDGAGNFYVADFQNSTVRQVTPSGIVTTLAGSPGLSGTLNGTGSSARFYNPTGLALDGSGNIYVADYGDHTIRKLSVSGSVTTFAGFPGTSGTADGTGSTARFFFPEGVATDTSGNVYISDQRNNTIRKITPGGVVTTLAGSPGISGTSDGTGSTARFNLPTHLLVDGTDTVYVADCYNHTIRKISPGGVVTTLAGSPGLSGTADGTGSVARFYYPQGMALDGSGNFYLADYGNHTIRKVTPNGTVTTVAGVPRVSGTSDSIAMTGSASLTIIVLPPAPVISSLLTATGTLKSPFSYQITASNSPTSYNASGLPDGLGIDSLSGLISGIPTAAGAFPATINASNAGGTGSALLAITVFPAPPQAPTGLTAIAGNAQVALGWNPSPGATAYNLWRSLLSGTNYYLLASNIVATAYTDPAVINGPLYYYVVSAVNPGGESPASAEVSARPMSPTAPGDSAPPVMTISGSTVQLTVLNSRSGSTYQLQRSDSLTPSAWTDIGSPQNGTGDALLLQEARDLSTVPHQFYRIQIVIP